MLSGLSNGALQNTDKIGEGCAACHLLFLRKYSSYAQQIAGHALFINLLLRTLISKNNNSGKIFNLLGRQKSTPLWPWNTNLQLIW